MSVDGNQVAAAVFIHRWDGEETSSHWSTFTRTRKHFLKLFICPLKIQPKHVGSDWISYVYSTSSYKKKVKFQLVTWLLDHLWVDNLEHSVFILTQSVNVMNKNGLMLPFKNVSMETQPLFPEPLTSQTGLLLFKVSRKQGWSKIHTGSKQKLNSNFQSKKLWLKCFFNHQIWQGRRSW